MAVLTPGERIAYRATLVALWTITIAGIVWLIAWAYMDPIAYT